MTTRKHYFRTMGIHPTANGFGWVICEGPFKLVEHGRYTAIRKNRRAAAMREFERLLARFRPAELVLEAFESDRRGRAKQARLLGLDMISVAVERGLTVEPYSREAIRAVFAPTGVKLRDEIAEAVARNFPGLAHRLPKKRQAWEAEDKRLAIFNAAAAVLTHFHNGATALLDELRNAA